MRGKHMKNKKSYWKGGKMIIETLVAGMIILTPVDDIKAWETEQAKLKEVECLAKNMYYEARNQGTAGKLAVTNVVLNRLKDKRFPNTICGVVKQGPTRESWKTKKDKNLPDEERIYYPIRHKCQFSWYCDGASDEPKNEEKYQEAYLLSLTIVDKKFHLIDITDGALFYHADYVRPAWARTKHRTTEIGDHNFYTWD